MSVWRGCASRSQRMLYAGFIINQRLLRVEYGTRHTASNIALHLSVLTVSELLKTDACEGDSEVAK